MTRHRNRRSHGGRGGRRRDRRQQSYRTVKEIWTDYLKDGYFDDDGYLRPQYVARSTVEPLVMAMATARPKLSRSQLRRFFQHCRRIEARLLHDNGAWGEVQPRVLFLDSAAQDALRTPDQKIPDLFYDFIRLNVATVKNAKDFLEGFIPHFEALVGFGSIHIKKQ